MSDRHAYYPEHFDDRDRAFVDAFESIPEGSFVQQIVVGIAWVDADGNSFFRSYSQGDYLVSGIIGLAEMVKLDILARFNNGIFSPAPDIDD